MKRNDKIQKEKDTIRFMIEIYCKGNHHKKELCKECQKLFDYASMRIDKCPVFETKTFCSSCKIHCYQKEEQARIKEVMRYSGPRMLLYHPVMAICHVIDTIKNYD